MMHTCINCGTSRPDEQMLHSPFYGQWACFDPELCFQAQAATGSTFISVQIGSGHLSAAEFLDLRFGHWREITDIGG